MENVACNLGAKEYETYLWAVSVCYDYIPSLFYHPSDVEAGLSCCIELVWYGLMVFVLNQGVAADCDYTHLSHINLLFIS
jgi:hypothetical protein